MSVCQMRTSEYEREERNQPLCSVQGSGQGSLQRGPSLKKEGVLPTPPSWKMVVLGPLICICDQNRQLLPPTSAKTCRSCLSPSIPLQPAQDDHFCLNLSAIAPNCSPCLHFVFSLKISLGLMRRTFTYYLN